jgi:very-short-patch-repair endonuclease
VKVLGVGRAIRVSGTRDQRIAAVAGRQRGRARRSQLRAVGLSDDTVDRLVASGYLIREHRAVYVVGHAAPTPLGRETAAVLACGDDVVLSHLTAARLHGLLRHDVPDGPIHITVPRRRHPVLEGVVVHRTSNLPDYDIRDHEGLPITSPIRTLLDVAEQLEQDELDWAVDEAIQQHMANANVLQRVAAEARGRRGASKLAAAARRHQGSGRTRSETEKRFRFLMRDSTLPQPIFNHWMLGCEYDAYWPELGLVVELDSEQWHSAKTKIEHDSAKGAAAVAAGLVVMRFTADQVWNGPLSVIARLAQAIARLQARLAA